MPDVSLFISKFGVRREEHAEVFGVKAHQDAFGYKQQKNLQTGS